MPVQTSIQLFTVNAALEADLEGTLAWVAARGFTSVEPYDFVRRAEPLAAALQAHGLAAPTGHAFLASTSFVNPDGSGTTVPVPSPETVFAAAKVLGMHTVIDPYTEPARWESREQIEETARLLNAAAEIGAQHGIRVGYHNHAHELEATFDGRTGLEVLADLLDERVVLEVDLYWVARAGVDSPTLLSTLGDRVIAVHVKDGTLDPEQVAAYPPADQVPAGQGAVPLAEAIAAATALEVAIVEFDHYDADSRGGDIYDAIEQSRAFLSGLGLDQKVDA
ncbi:xylose isomerase [Microbacterium sp. Root53]|uniref:sugar phosphate isomerase/epimerase family protein n=1 Tax=Microbacterium sp. Root53 TaxID=1736553 RepID=UPI0006F94DFB|nr:sugar phosphate isomerase/epimerase [Microbacterium sp. Root53]KQZ09922.1 xylose isomerase [Microbacterium sp. Root53]